MVKSPPAVQETRVLSLGREYPPAKEMVTHSSILAQRIPRTEEPGRLQLRVAKSQTQWRTNTLQSFARREKAVSFLLLKVPVGCGKQSIKIRNQEVVTVLLPPIPTTVTVFTVLSR